jgi:hypothetical protein
MTDSAGETAQWGWFFGHPWPGDGLLIVEEVTQPETSSETRRCRMLGSCLALVTSHPAEAIGLALIALLFVCCLRS